MFVFICLGFVSKMSNEHRGTGKVRRGTAFFTRLLRVVDE